MTFAKSASGRIFFVVELPAAGMMYGRNVRGERPPGRPVKLNYSPMHDERYRFAGGGDPNDYAGRIRRVVACTLAVRHSHHVKRDDDSLNRRYDRKNHSFFSSHESHAMSGT